MAVSVASRRGALLHQAVPAVISCLTLLLLTLVLGWGAGHPERFPSESAYDAVMNAAILARLGPVYFSGLIVWWAMRARGASMRWSIAGVLASPAVFALAGGWAQLTFFPPAQAAYYMLNPMVVAALGAQAGSAAVGEVLLRWRRLGWPAARSIVAPCLLIAVAGFALLYAGVIWDGGTHVFYVWMTGFTWLFGTGQ